jgi:hypothetical protein
MVKQTSVGMLAETTVATLATSNTEVAPSIRSWKNKQTLTTPNRKVYDL